MTLMNVVRIAKVLALLAFVLPWAAVSCNNVDVATASGIELIQGTMSKNPEAGRQFSRQMGSASAFLRHRGGGCDRPRPCAELRGQGTDGGAQCDDHQPARPCPVLRYGVVVEGTGEEPVRA